MHARKGRRRGIVWLLWIVVVGYAGLPLLFGWGGPTLSPDEVHEHQEKREKEQTRHALERGRLTAPPDGATRALVEPPYPSRATPTAGGLGRPRGRLPRRRPGGDVGRRTPSRGARGAAVAHRVTGRGSRRSASTASGTVFFSARNTNADPGVAISDDGGRTWRRSIPPEPQASLDPYIWVDEQTGSIFASDIDPPVTCTPISRSDDDGKTWRYSRACGVTDHQNHFGGPPPPDGEKPDGLPERPLLLRDQRRRAVGHLDDHRLPEVARRRPGLATDRRPGVPAEAGPGHRGASATARPATASSTAAAPSTSRAAGAARRRSRSAATRARRGRGARSPTSAMPTFSHETASPPTAPATSTTSSSPTTTARTSSISRDGGNTWERGARHHAAGRRLRLGVRRPRRRGRARAASRIVFMGTRRRRSRTRSRAGRAYMGTSHDALAADPLFYAAPANDPRDEHAVEGPCDDLRCGNIGDFLDVEIGPDGSVVDGAGRQLPGRRRTSASST